MKKMSILELKNSIHKLTVEAEDEDILTQVEAYFQFLLENK